MTEYWEYHIKMGGFIFDKVLLGKNKIRYRLKMENNLKNLILNF